MFDKLKMHNAKQCHVIGKIRTEMMKQNAKLADWIVECIGENNLIGNIAAATSKTYFSMFIVIDNLPPATK